MIVRYRCDVPMARRKGILGKCDKRCRSCLCAIGMSEHGYESHVSLDQGGTSENLASRNLEVLNGRRQRR